MDLKPIVFIHSNAAHEIPSAVAAYALKARSRRPTAFDVKVLRLEETPHLYRREGQRYVRGNLVLTWRNRDANSDGPLRMMIPQVTGYRGRALVLDPDVFAIGDVNDLLERDMKGRAIVCQTRREERGFPRQFHSSVMLLDCEQLTHWMWNDQIDAMFQGKLDPIAWMRLENEKADSIGTLEEEWNHRDTLSANTRLLHNTERITQPWKTGLPVDFDLNHIGAEPLVRPRFRERVRGKAWRMLHPARRPDIHRPHPDLRQERHFFSLLRECLDCGAIERAAVEEEIWKGRLRPDALDLADAAPSSASVAGI